MKPYISAFVAFALLMGVLFSPFATSTAQAASNCGDTYTVQNGDYLTKIAKNCAVPYETLLKANPGIKDPNRIFPGQVIRLKAATSTPATPSPTVPAGSTDEYVVVKGDTLFKIAVRFGTTTAELVKLNPEIKNTSLIYAGQKIRVKTGAASNGNITLSSASVKAGDVVEVKVKGFPANAEIDFRLGVEGKTFSVVADGKTDANGETSAKMTLPTSAKTGEKWAVTVLTTNLVNGKEVKSPVITMR